MARVVTSHSGYVPSPSVFGFVKGRSTRDNAARHLGARCVLRLDIADFFGSIHREMVETELAGLGGFDSTSASVVAELATPLGSLAVGLSSSPVLSNIVFSSTDVRLDALATELGVTYTRYVDDLSFSGEIDDALAGKLVAEIEAAGWVLNPRKTKFMRRGHAQYVTGLSVSDPRHSHVPRDLKARMRWRLHMIEKVGFDAYWDDFGGEDYGHTRRTLMGLARYLVHNEPTLSARYLERWEDALYG